jgi:hypothetical protein
MATVLAQSDFPVVQWVGGKSRDNGAHHPTKWTTHQFNCFDGEGMDINGKHQYVYLAAYDGSRHYEVCNPKGLGTDQCFKFLVNMAVRNPLGINCIYGGSYDANMMFKDLTVPALMELQKRNTCRWHNWRIQFVNRKELTVIHLPTRQSCKLWDTIGFYQSSFVAAIRDWLDVVDDTIAKGKASRHDFNIAELDFIIDYCKRELVLFESLMQRLWSTLNSVGIKLHRWDGAGAAAHSVLGKKKISTARGSESQNEQHYLQARCAYAGGRFELISPGDYRCTIYNYDINSAYPYAMSQLPSFTGLRTCKRKDCVYTQYDLLKIHYDSEYHDPCKLHDWVEIPFCPYFHRLTSYQVCYPMITTGWHWGIEYQTCGGQGEVLEHLHWDDTGERPFSWVADYYKYRYELKDKQDKAEKAVKLVINSLYGKLAQQRGWKPGKQKPQFHQLYWAGWITACTRSMMYQAMMQDKHSVIACETDGLFCTKPRDLPIGKGLGEWGLKTYQDITYVQSGMYFGTDSEGKDVTRYRGLDPGQLTRDMVLAAWESGQESVEALSTRFRTLGTSLQGARLNQWRQWTTELKEVKLRPQGKRMPDPFDRKPWGKGLHHLTVPSIGKEMKLYESAPYNVLWADMTDKLDFWNELEIDEERYIHEA